MGPVGRDSPAAGPSAVVLCSAGVAVLTVYVVFCGCGCCCEGSSSAVFIGGGASWLLLVVGFSIPSLWAEIIGDSARRAETATATTPADASLPSATAPPGDRTTNIHDSTPARSTSEQAEADQAAAGDDDSPVQWFEEVEDSPPHVPFSGNSQAEVTQLGEGRWHLAIRADKGKSTKKLAGLPLAVVEGEGGDVDDAPPLPIGLEGILEFLTEDLWVLTVELTPPHPNYERDTMLLSPGDRLLLERSLTGWQIRVEHLDPNCPPPIQRLRQRRRETLATAARNTNTAAAGTRGRRHLPSIPEGSETRDSQASSSSTDRAGTQHTSEATVSPSSSSSHETPQSYYPQARNKQQPPAVPERTHTNTLADGRELRKSQLNKPPQSQPQQTQPTQPPTQQQQQPGTQTEPSLASMLSDGHNLGRRGQRGEPTTTITTTEHPPGGTTSTTTPTALNHPTGAEESDTSPLVQTYANIRPTIAAAAEASQSEGPEHGTSATQQQTPTTPIETPPADTPLAVQPPIISTSSSSNASSGAHLVSLRTPTPQAHTQEPLAEAGEPSSGSNDRRPTTRSWQRVEQKLVEIRRIAEQHDGSQAEAIAQAADTALIDLLVDTPTAMQLDAGEQHPTPQGTTKAAAAISAAQQLSSLAKSLLGKKDSVVVPYAMVSSQVAALIEWLETLDQGSIAVHVQLPPVLTPLREILDQMLQGQPGNAATWARLVAVAEAFEALISGETLTHPSDVLGQSQGGTESPLLCAEGVAPDWYNAVETTTTGPRLAHAGIANDPASSRQPGSGDCHGHPGAAPRRPGGMDAGTLVVHRKTPWAGGRSPFYSWERRCQLFTAQPSTTSSTQSQLGHKPPATTSASGAHSWA